MLSLRHTPVTALLLAVIIGVFGLEWYSGGSTDTEVLTRLGGNVKERVLEGEWWRLVTSVFLHIGIFHLFVNGWALMQLGTLFERWIGSGKLLFAFLLCGIAGSAASVAWRAEGLSAGASGAIFGLLGTLITFLLRRREMLVPAAKSILSQLVMWAGINIFLGFSVPGIDNAAHLGGLAAGLVLGLILRERPRLAPPPSYPEIPV